THDQARARLDSEVEVYPSQLNGSGPWAWNRHWLIVPLQDGQGALLGIIWVDNPSDRLVPSADRLQALRIFANDAAAALVSGRQAQRELRVRRVSGGRGRPADAVPPRRRGPVRREAERHRAALRRARVTVSTGHVQVPGTGTCLFPPCAFAYDRAVQKVVLSE